MDHVFFGQRFEIELVGSVVIRADGFRVTVDHDAFNAFFTKCKRGMDTTVIELNPLADSVGAAAQNHHLFLVRDPGFIFHFIGGVVIRCCRLELRSACIHQLVNGTYVISFSGLFNGFLGGTG